jgi:hypothetical protein
MAHFVELDENNKVIRGIVIHNNELLDDNGNESEQKGIYFCKNLYGGNWIQTSYNTYGGIHKLEGTPFRKNYAGIGYTFDGVGFAAPQPYPSWIFDTTTYLWSAPTPMPEDVKVYTWDEATTSWVEVIL